MLNKLDCQIMAIIDPEDLRSEGSKARAKSAVVRRRKPHRIVIPTTAQEVTAREAE